MKGIFLSRIIIAFLLAIVSTCAASAHYLKIKNENTKDLMVMFKSKDDKKILKKVTVSSGKTIEIRDFEKDKTITDDQFLIYGTLGFSRGTYCKDEYGDSYVLNKKTDYTVTFAKNKIGTTCTFFDQNQIFYK